MCGWDFFFFKWGRKTFILKNSQLYLGYALKGIEEILQINFAPPKNSPATHVWVTTQFLEMSLGVFYHSVKLWNRHSVIGTGETSLRKSKQVKQKTGGRGCIM